MYRVFAFKPRHVLTTEVSVDALRASAVFSTPAPGPSGGAVADRSTHTPTNIVNIGAITELCTVLKHEANACGMQSVMAAVKQRRAGFTARCKVLLLRMARKRRRKPTFNWSLDAYDQPCVWSHLSVSTLQAVRPLQGAQSGRAQLLFLQQKLQKHHQLLRRHLRTRKEQFQGLIVQTQTRAPSLNLARHVIGRNVTSPVEERRAPKLSTYCVRQVCSQTFIRV